MDNNLHQRQSIGISSIGNARELGGYETADGSRVKRGIFLRTARLSTGTAEDLRRLSEVYHVQKIIDLRSEEEVNGSKEIALFTGKETPDPDPSVDGAEYMNLPILDLKKMMLRSEDLIKEIDGKLDFIKMLTLSIKAGFISDELYYGFLDDDIGRRSYSRMFREILALDEGRAVLYHCTQGKDRTGVASMLILSALGVPEETIIEDYLLTNVFNSELIAKEKMMLEKSGKVPPDMTETYLMAMDRVNEKTMTNVLSHMKQRCGSVLDYIRNELNVSDGEIAELRARFLE